MTTTFILLYCYTIVLSCIPVCSVVLTSPSLLSRHSTQSSEEAGFNDPSLLENLQSNHVSNAKVPLPSACTDGCCLGRNWEGFGLLIVCGCIMSLLPFKVDLGDIADLCWRVCCDWKLVKRIWCFMACIIVFGAKRRILTDKLTSYQFDLKSCWRVDYCFFTGHCKHRQASNLISSFWQEEDMFICLSTVGNCTAVDSYIRVNLWIWILKNNIFYLIFAFVSRRALGHAVCWCHRTVEGAVKATCDNEMGENCDWLAVWVAQLQNSVGEAGCHIWLVQ